jgi:hypothetical protein
MRIIPFTFVELYHLYHFTATTLDQEAKVPTGTTDLMLQGQPVARQWAHQVLKALSLRTKRYYTLHTVQVALLPTEPKELVGGAV